MGPPRRRNRLRAIIAAAALIALATGSAPAVAGLSSPPTSAASNTATTGNWTDNAAGNANDLVANGQSDSQVVPYGSTSYYWSGLAPGTYMCFAAALADGANADSGWSQRACATTPWSDTDAR